MIKQDLNITLDSYTLEGVINVPSAVMTSTPQEEELNLAYSPNFVILAYDMNGLIEGNDKRKVSFTLGDYDYTAYVKPAQRLQTGYMLLNYVDSMTQATHVEPEPEIHTLRFSSTYLGCSLDNYNGATVVSNDFTVLYDDENISIEQEMLQGMEHVYVTIKDDTKTGFFTPNDRQEIGEYEDTVTIEYEDLTATCWVGCSITDSTPAPEPEHQVTIKWGEGPVSTEGDMNKYGQVDPFTSGMGVSIVILDENDNNISSQLIEHVRVTGNDGINDYNFACSYTDFSEYSETPGEGCFNIGPQNYTDNGGDYTSVDWAVNVEVTNEVDVIGSASFTISAGGSW